MKNFKQFLKENNNSQILITHMPYEKEYKKWLSQVIQKLKKDKDILSKFKLNIEEIQTILQELEYPELEKLLSNIKNKKFIKEYEKYRKWRFSNSYNMIKKLREKHITHEQLKSVDNQLSLQTDVLFNHNIDQEIQEKIDKFKENLQLTKMNLNKMVNFIKSAVSRISNWNNSKITISPIFNSDVKYYDEILPSVFFTIKVGTKPAEFHLAMNNKISDLVEEDGLKHDIEKLEVDSDENEEFFDNNYVISDYYNLIKEIELPYSSSKSKVLTLYTTRPRKDREYYEKHKTLPVNLFLTNDLEHAEGYSVESGFSSNNEPRDVWKVKVDSKYLNKTYSGGKINYYQVIQDDVPTKEMKMISVN
jgi:hypothetical protein